MRVIGGIAGSGPAAPLRAVSPPIAPAIRLSSQVRRAVAPLRGAPDAVRWRLRHRRQHGAQRGDLLHQLGVAQRRLRVGRLLTETRCSPLFDAEDLARLGHYVTDQFPLTDYVLSA